MSVPVVKEPYAVNTCRVCASLGAVFAFKGIEGCVPLIHGSQGCATYVRRYMISHFREPVDAASSSFNEESAVFGGGESLKKAVNNVTRQYSPSCIGVMSTCLTETIGEDMHVIIKDIKSKEKEAPELIEVSTPSYAYSYEEGFRDAATAAIQKLAVKGSKTENINIFSSILSPADIRLIKEYMMLQGIKYTFFPDYSETLDGGQWDEYTKIPTGGTKVDSLRNSSGAPGTIELGFNPGTFTPGNILKDRFDVKNIQVPMPVGIDLTDRFMVALEQLTVTETPEIILNTRSRLIDSYMDGHKYVFGAKIAVLGDPALAASVVSFAMESGMKPVLCATGCGKGSLSMALKHANTELPEDCMLYEDADFGSIEEKCPDLQVDLVLGNSKCYRFSKSVKAPLIRIGFPIHDRFGGARLRHVLYDGTQELFDRCVNALMDKKQEDADLAYSYM